ISIHRRKAVALLAYLALSEQRQSRDTLCAVLWPDLDQDHARGSLRSTLSALTTLLPDVWVDKDRDSLALNKEEIWIDVKVFLSLLARGRSHDHDPDQLCEECVQLLSQAVDLYRSDFMGSFTVPGCSDYDDWQSTQREWLRHELARALRRLA